MPRPTGPQFTRVYHASHSPEPPHEVEPDFDSLGLYSNADKDSLHMGDVTTVKSSNLSSRPYLHAYDLPSHKTYPVVMGDEQDFIDEEYIMNENGEKSSFSVKMSGVQEGLFEGVSATPELAYKAKMAIPYRNRVEGQGRISYIVPKTIINNDNVKYQGVFSHGDI
jgi:hypothetical protein